MASEQIMSEVIAKALTEATRIALKTIAEVQVERTHDRSGPKLGGPAMKQPTFDWGAQGKYES